MVDDYRNRHVANTCFLLDQVFHVDVKIDRPAESGDTLDAAIEHVNFDVAAGAVEQVEAHAANTAVVQPLEFVTRRRVIDASDAAKLTGGIFDRVESRGIVEAMHARLNHDGAPDADDGDHFAIMLQGRGGRRVLVSRDKWKLLRRAEDVEMGVTGIRRRGGFRLACIRIERIAVGHFLISPRQSFSLVRSWCPPAEGACGVLIVLISGSKSESTPSTQKMKEQCHG